jgi:hypothetical protein
MPDQQEPAWEPMRRCHKCTKVLSETDFLKLKGNGHICCAREATRHHEKARQRLQNVRGPARRVRVHHAHNTAYWLTLLSLTATEHSFHTYTLHFYDHLGSYKCWVCATQSHAHRLANASTAPLAYETCRYRPIPAGTTCLDVGSPVPAMPRPRQPDNTSCGGIKPRPGQLNNISCGGIEATT